MTAMTFCIVSAPSVDGWFMCRWLIQLASVNHKLSLISCYTLRLCVKFRNSPTNEEEHSLSLFPSPSLIE